MTYRARRARRRERNLRKRGIRWETLRRIFLTHWPMSDVVFRIDHDGERYSFGGSPFLRIRPPRS